ncbi:MAG: aminotransferase class IV [Ghiorsea sp.]|nr:aminotransferase class IV [Ghiorsea sp.]
MKKHLVAYVNNTFVPLNKAYIHIEDRGFQFADGVYEVVACFGGAYLDLMPHLQRLEKSCIAIAIGLPKSLNELQNLVEKAYQENPFEDAMIYIQITRGVSPRAHVVDKPMTPTLVITVRELPKPSEEKLKQGTKAITMQDIRWKHCEIKSIALLANVMGKQESLKQHVDEAFWLDQQGHVLEGCATNVLAVIGGVLVTHPLDHQVLGGITRTMALQVAKGAGVDIEERPWKLDEIGLTECMMSSTTNAVLPVCMVDKKEVGDGKPGEISLRIRNMILRNIKALRKRG